MKRSINNVPKLSGKPINDAKEKKYLTYSEVIATHSALSILRNTHPSTKGFIRDMSKLRRYAIASRIAWGYKGDYDPDKVSYYSRMRKGFPVFDNNRIRVYKTRSGATRAIKKIVGTGLLSEQKLILVYI